MANRSSTNKRLAPRALHPTELYLALDTRIADDAWLEWDVETLLATLEDTFDEVEKGKIAAVQSAAAYSELAVSDAVALEKIITAFNNDQVITDQWQAPLIEEASYAVDQLRRLVATVHNVAKDDVVLRGDTPLFIAALARHHKWRVLPHTLAFAQASLDSISGAKAWSDDPKVQSAGLDALRRTVRSLEEVAPAELKEPTWLEKLAKGDAYSRMLLRVIGALLFDPTEEAR